MEFRVGATVEYHGDTGKIVDVIPRGVFVKFSDSHKEEFFDHSEAEDLVVVDTLAKTKTATQHLTAERDQAINKAEEILIELSNLIERFK